MKKMLAMVLAVCLTLSLTATAFAAEQDTDVTLSVDSTYTVTIPETVALEAQTDGTYTGTANIVCPSARILETEKINVTMASDFTLATAKGSTLPYTVTVGDNEIATGDKVATFGTSTTQQSSTLSFAAGVPTYAGDYSDTVVFTIAVEEETAE